MPIGGVSKRKDFMKISKVIFHIKLIPSHPLWECKKQSRNFFKLKNLLVYYNIILYLIIIIKLIFLVADTICIFNSRTWIGKTMMKVVALTNKVAKILSFSNKNYFLK